MPTQPCSAIIFCLYPLPTHSHKHTFNPFRTKARSQKQKLLLKKKKEKEKVGLLGNQVWKSLPHRSVYSKLIHPHLSRPSTRPLSLWNSHSKHILLYRLYLLYAVLSCCYSWGIFFRSCPQTLLSIAKLDASVANTLARGSFPRKRTAARDFGGVCCPWDEKPIHANHLSMLSDDIILSLHRFMLSKWIRDKL